MVPVLTHQVPSSYDPDSHTQADDEAEARRAYSRDQAHASMRRIIQAHPHASHMIRDSPSTSPPTTDVKSHHSYQSLQFHLEDTVEEEEDEDEFVVITPSK